MLHGLDLFSGIGGLTLALAPWVRPVAYCENDRFAQAVLLNRMHDGGLPRAPIWDDVRTLRARDLPPIDIVYGGVPCQDFSIAGAGRGLEGERSGLFFEVIRLVEEARPAFLFFENVPAVRSRGLNRIVYEIARLGFVLEWGNLSAQSVGAPHLRRRWFCFAIHPERARQSCADMADAFGDRSQDGEPIGTAPGAIEWGVSPWATESGLDRVVNELPARVDRIRCLGNAVVPLQARTAFRMLSGLH